MSVILIAEDEEPLLETLVEVVRAMGHIALGAQDGDQALQLARGHHLDLIRQRLHDAASLRHRAVARARGGAGAGADSVRAHERGEPARAGGATRFLAKPITLPTFERTVREVNPRRRRQRAAGDVGDRRPDARGARFQRRGGRRLGRARDEESASAPRACSPTSCCATAATRKSGAGSASSTRSSNRHVGAGRVAARRRHAVES